LHFFYTFDIRIYNSEIYSEGALMPNHNADIKNKNRGTNGTNKTYDKNQGNRGKQLNPNQTKGS